MSDSVLNWRYSVPKGFFTLALLIGKLETQSLICLTFGYDVLLIHCPFFTFFGGG